MAACGNPFKDVLLNRRRPFHSITERPPPTARIADPTLIGVVAPTVGVTAANGVSDIPRSRKAQCTARRGCR